MDTVFWVEEHRHTSQARYRHEGFLVGGVFVDALGVVYLRADSATGNDSAVATAKALTTLAWYE